MKLYQTVNQIPFAIATHAGPGTDPFASYLDVWDGDKCRWTFPTLPPVGSYIDVGPGPHAAAPRAVHKVHVDRHEFVAIDGQMVLVLVTSKV